MSIRLLPGVHVPHRKHTAEMAAERIPVLAVVRIPLSMNIRQGDGSFVLALGFRRYVI